MIIVVEVIYQLGLCIIQTLAIIVGIAYYITISKKQQKTRENILESRELARKAQEQTLETRKTQIFMEIYNETYINDSFINAYVRLADISILSYEEYLELMEDEEIKKASTKIAMFFEGVGVLVREGHVNIRLFALLMTGMTRSWWERNYKPCLEEGRIKRNFPRWMSESEYLYNEMMKFHKEHPELAT